MPLFGAHTPESVLGRRDSKNPATTCKGLTSNGRPCRRTISGAAIAQDGVLAVSSIDACSESAAAAFYCWQHKDQAERLVDESASPSRKTRLVPLQERTSIESLVERIGVLELDPEPETAIPSHHIARDSGRRYIRGDPAAHHVRRPPTWDSVQSPVIEVPVDAFDPGLSAVKRKQRDRASVPPGKSRPRKSSSLWSRLCFGIADDDYVEVVRHKRRNRPTRAPEMEEKFSRQRLGHRENASRPESSSFEARDRRDARQEIYEDQCDASGRAKTRVYQDENAKSASKYPSRANKIRLPSLSASDQTSAPRPMAQKPPRLLNTSAPSLETSRLLLLIPPSLSPQTTALLLAELSKPISSSDEPGYIYIFWLTPESQSTPTAEAAASLLNAHSPADSCHQRRPSDVLRNQPGVRDTGGKRTILLKIGRARNVHRRMAQWENQCGYAPSLLRFYPHVSSPSQSPATTPDTTPRRPSLSPETSEYLRKMSETHARASRSTLPTLHSTNGSGAGEHRSSLSLVPSSAANVRHVPNVKRVERLIQIELADKRVKMECEACGRVHMEWFEAEANREGIKMVDETVRRWIEWSERNVGRN